ncbi:MAG: hypothetical protein K0U29_07190 [Gammaproteobacteria bacterium]|nr:hypothetical protein [Gammaproteobacteria bacterium]MCH9744696.1 hypothetical protein [Gammaproteobacteria bacterium]
MAKQSEDTLMSTYAKLSLNDWQVLADLIRKHSATNTTAEPDEDVNAEQQVLDLEQINNAVEGPLQAFFHQKMQAYSHLAQVRMALTIENDDTFKENMNPQNHLGSIDKKLLEKLDQDKITDLKSQLDELTEQHIEQWQQHFSDWATLIAQDISASGIELSELEISELQTAEPISELLKRYTALNIDKPKTKQSGMNYSNYLTLKANLAIHSALSRQHQTHDTKAINQYLKHLKKDLDSIYKAEQQIISTQQQETDILLKLISY